MGAEIYVLRQANGISIRQTSKQGYFDATAMCEAWGKLFADYARLQSTQEFLTELESVMGIPISDLVRSRRDGPYESRGTWVHRRVAYHLAQWCSPAFAVMVSGWIDDWMSGNHPVASEAQQQLIIKTLDDHSEKIQGLSNKQTEFDKRLVLVERTVRKHPNTKQVKLLANAVFDHYGGMDPALGKYRVVDDLGNRLPNTEIDHWNNLRHDNRIANLWLIHAESHKLKTAGRDFLAEFTVFQKRLTENGPEQLALL